MNISENMTNQNNSKLSVLWDPDKLVVFGKQISSLDYESFFAYIFVIV